MLTKHNFTVYKGVEFTNSTILVNSLSGYYNLPDVFCVIRNRITDEPIAEVPCSISAVADANGVEWDCEVTTVLSTEVINLIPYAQMYGVTLVGGAKYWYKAVYRTGQERKLGGGEIFAYDVS